MLSTSAISQPLTKVSPGFSASAIAQSSPQSESSKVVADRAAEVSLSSFASAYQLNIDGDGAFYSALLRGNPEEDPIQMLALWGVYFAERRPVDGYSLEDAAEFQSVVAFAAVEHLCSEQLQRVVDASRP